MPSWMNWNVNTEIFISWLKNTRVDPNTNFCFSVIYIPRVSSQRCLSGFFQMKSCDIVNGFAYLQTSRGATTGRLGFPGRQAEPVPGRAGAREPRPVPEERPLVSASSSFLVRPEPLLTPRRHGPGGSSPTSHLVSSGQGWAVPVSPDPSVQGPRQLAASQGSPWAEPSVLSGKKGHAT